MEDEENQEAMLISNQLKKFRMARELSQQALGDILDVSNQQYSKYEANINRIAAFQILKISNHFSVPIEKFFKDCEFNEVDS